MLPSILSREIKEGIRRFLLTTFPPATPLFDGALETLLNEPGAVFKGPYFSLRLPFKSAVGESLPFREVTFPYPPYRHQILAFRRLCGDEPKSTLVATGTGSGKTDCFQFPILDYCATHPSRKGIKAIVIYPMNALATDQAKRFARAVHEDEATHGKVRVGMYVGGEGDEADAMAPEWVITSREAMRKNPPDILLTNYKMLDYLLIRPDDLGLWAENDAETLKFVAVDELHTFDGAQATDLACLLRRLKVRLHTPDDYLCCIGTSATIGGDESANKLIGYAETLFGESFDEAAETIVREHLVSHGEFTDRFYIKYMGVPGEESSNALRPASYQTQTEYLRAQYELWFHEPAPDDIGQEDWRVSLGERLREHSLLRNLLLFFERVQHSQIDEQELLQEFALMNPDLRDEALAFQVLDSISSLCSHARYRDPKLGDSGKAFPFLKTHVHLWLRELSRMVSTIESPPRLGFSADLKKEDISRALPIMHCRDCGAMGWGGTMRNNEDKLNPDLDVFYESFFGKQPKLRLVFPIGEEEWEHFGKQEFPELLCGNCLTLSKGPAKKCPGCSSEEQLFQVLIRAETKKQGDRTQADIACPFCETRNGLTILGSRAASLTSVALGQTFATPFNDDKQALAFSDNIQDASHRASFFGARTFRTVLRTAISRVLPKVGETCSLTDFQDKFIQHWRGATDDETFVGTFLAPNMEWMRDYEHLKKEGRLPPVSSLPFMVEKRLRWELATEFGFRSRIGRTLEKSGVSIGYISPRQISEAAEELTQYLHEKSGGFGSIGREVLEPFLLGLLHRLRTGGGVFQNVLELYVKEGGNTWHLNKEDWMPGFGKAGRAPTFFTMGSAQPGRHERVVSTGSSPSWLQRWASKVLPIPGGITKEATATVIEGALHILTETGLLRVEDVKNGNRAWGLVPERILISSEAEQIACDRCGHGVSCAKEERGLWFQAQCQRDGCSGLYGERPQDLSYFGELYRSGDVVRIHTAEHTSLIERQEREWVERRFMTSANERRSTDPNLLSCTPTLEMGIDIGDLSSVVLCSVPPTTANYLQRVGRAGRRDGNAFSLTVANAQPHDLYFYTQPREMMDGEVRVPGVFLNAPAVLERQFIAFAFDRWIESTQPPPFIPAKIGPTLKTILSPGDPPEGFPFGLLEFVQQNLASLRTGFFEMFGEQLGKDARDFLLTFSEGKNTDEGSLPWKILSRFREVAKEREDLRKRRAKVGERVKKLEKVPVRDEATEDELQELIQTRRSLAAVIQKIGDTNTLQFFTDEGLLPNYAFPEEGVTLRSVILRKRPPSASSQKGKYEAISLEYQRPAVSAIRELAPGNRFYAEGRKLTIDQVNLDLSEKETWNFCDQCSWIERIDLGDPPNAQCPNCGSTQWADTSLQRSMLRMKQVVTTEFDRNSRTQDESDERTPEFFNRQMSVAIPEAEIQRAFQVKSDELAFGFEFVRQATFREVNLGREGSGEGTLTIGGVERRVSGFHLCPKCGKVQGARAWEKDKFKHDISCPLRDKPTETHPLDAHFLYRELTSEALRLLVPSVSANETTEMASFVAALEIGLLAWFGGDIDHLTSCEESRPIPGTDFRRRYLVVYDRVPGGTGYLKELTSDPEKLLTVLDLACQWLRDCSCASNSELDGCHRCVLKNQRRRGANDPQRSVAIGILEKILSHREDVEQISALSTIDINPLLESELEKLFLEALKDTEGFNLKTQMIEGKEGYMLVTGANNWEVIPQYEIPASSNIPHATRPDFVFRSIPSRGLLPIAVYLDGFAFHADAAAGNNRVGKDIAQREGLRRSGKWITWSLTWEDLTLRNSKQSPTALHPGISEEQRAKSKALWTSLDPENSKDWFQSVTDESAWGHLTDYLKTPEPERWKSYAYVLLLSLAAMQRSDQGKISAVISTLLNPASPGESALGELASGEWAGFAVPSPEDGRWEGLIAAKLESFQNHSRDDLRGLFRFNDAESLDPDQFAPAWRGLLKLYNLGQFLPGVSFVTNLGLANGWEGLLEETWWEFGGAPGEDPQPKKIESTDESSLSQISLDLSLLHEDLHELCQQLEGTDHAMPEIGYELIGEDNTVVAEAELAWPDQKVGVFLEDQEADLALFDSFDWKCLSFDKAHSDTQKLFTELSTLID